MTVPSDSAATGLTVKEIVLRLEAKFDAYVSIHEQRHAADTAQGLQASSDPNATPAGRAIQAQVQAINAQGSTANNARLSALESRVEHMEDRNIARDAAEKERAELVRQDNENLRLATQRAQWRIGVIAGMSTGAISAIIAALLKVYFHL